MKSIEEIIESNNVCTVLLYLFKIDEKRIITKVTKKLSWNPTLFTIKGFIITIIIKLKEHISRLE